MRYFLFNLKFHLYIIIQFKIPFIYYVSQWKLEVATETNVLKQKE